jgi:isopenicillin N synthase-like dioxygenase
MSVSKQSSIPIVDLANFSQSEQARHRVAGEIAAACEKFGFFYVVNHGVDESLQTKLEDMSRRFFALTPDEKNQIRMSLGGRAWRGYFAVGAELTSGKPDLKEGIYFGAEHGDEHPLVQNKTPMFGRNLFPEQIPDLKTAVLEYIFQMERLGHLLMQGVSLSLGFEADYFASNYTSDPLVLFRIFNYPPAPPSDSASFGVGEHTDYGMLTILRQDESGGLEIKVDSEWMAAPPLKNSFVCNIGDMLDRVTKGKYLSAPHRVRNVSGRDRISFAFFFDPNFAAEIKPIDSAASVNENRSIRWDGQSVHEFAGTYGDYLLAKVSKVFPELKREIL